MNRNFPISSGFQDNGAFVMFEKKFQVWDPAKKLVYLQLKMWEAYGHYEKSWNGRVHQLHPGQLIVALSSFKADGISPRVAKRCLDELRADGLIDFVTLAEGKRSEGTLVTFLSANRPTDSKKGNFRYHEREHGKGHGESRETGSQQGLREVSHKPERTQGNTGGHGVEYRSREDRRHITLLPPAPDESPSKGGTPKTSNPKARLLKEAQKICAFLFLSNLEGYRDFRAVDAAAEMALEMHGMDALRAIRDEAVLKEAALPLKFNPTGFFKSCKRKAAGEEVLTDCRVT